MAQYAAALVFPNELSRQIDALRQDYLQYVHYVHYSIQPHITLVYPFTPDADITLIKEKMRQVAQNSNPFTLVLDGFEYFEGENVAYIAVADKEPVTELHYALNQSIDDLISGEFKGRFDHLTFVPHLTIGAQIPDDVF